ncbi:MAG: ISAs1 family transposase [Pseudomonadota bacterium]
MITNTDAWKNIRHQLELRLICPHEKDQWKEMMQLHHYLGFGRIVGESLCYVASINGQWLALIGWGSAALHCRHRESGIGWNSEIKSKRLHFIANNVRFLILPQGRIPNLASYVLARNIERLSQDWERCYAHPILFAETFVDPSRFRGTCYHAAGWLCLGTTQGYGKRGKHYVSHGCQKTYWLRPMTTNSSSQITAPFPPKYEVKMKKTTALRQSSMTTLSFDPNKLPLEGEGSLIDMLRTIVDPRKPRGVRYPVATVVAIAVCAALSGARSFISIAEYASGLSRETLRRLGGKRHRAPSEPTIRRVCQKLDAAALDRKVGDWIANLVSPKDKAIAIDGKTLRGSFDNNTKPIHLLSAVLHQEALVLAQINVEAKTNEIPMLPKLIAHIPLQGAVITADAIHTQRETARYIVEKKKADYLFTVKDNQQTLKQDILDLNIQTFPPSSY